MYNTQNGGERRGGGQTIHPARSRPRRGIFTRGIYFYIYTRVRKVIVFLIITLTLLKYSPISLEVYNIYYYIQGDLPPRVYCTVVPDKILLLHRD